MPETKMTTEASAGQYGPQACTGNIFGLNKQELDAIEVLGFELYQQGRNVESQAIFRGLIELDRNFYRGYAGLGALALAERKLDEAVQWLGQAAERNPNDATVRANLGETWMRLGQFDRAAQEFEAAFRLDAQQTDPGTNRARALLAGLKTITNESSANSALENFSNLEATSDHRNR